MSSFNDYKNIDSRLVMYQFHELEYIYSYLNHHDIKMDKVFVVCSIIDKLTQSWRDIKKTLYHKEEDMNLSQLGTARMIITSKEK